MPNQTGGMPSVSTKTTPGPAPGGMGTGLFATTDLSPTSDILTISTPFVAVLDTPRLEDTCSGCLGKRQLLAGGPPGGDGELKACTGCRVVRYCDKTCQSKDWKSGHGLECRIYQSLKPSVLPNIARAVVRVVLRCTRGKYTAEEMGLFEKAETHIDEIKQRDETQYERIVLLAKAVKTYAESGTGKETGFGEEMIAAFAARLHLNTFNLTNAVCDRIGIYFHPYAGLINHSCEYNSIVGFDGVDLYVKAIRPIKKDEQIFISYTDATNPSKVRQRELAERYFFTCQCSKCVQGVKTREDAFLADTTAQNAAMVESAEKQAQDQLDAVAGAEPSESIKNLQSGMHMLKKTGLWPTTRQPYVTLRDSLITSYLEAGKFNSAFIQAAIRYKRIDPIVYTQPAHPIRQLHAWTLAKLAIYISQGVEENTGDISLQRVELNYGLIIWSVLEGLVKGEGCIVPTFRMLIWSAFEEVRGQFVQNGIELERLGREVEREWEKVEKVASEVLQGE